jgi:hypothetical protein
MTKIREVKDMMMLLLTTIAGVVSYFCYQYGRVAGHKDAIEVYEMTMKAEKARLEAETERRNNS